tara:strand:+ start:162 stop:317 length:156 start_codon:yes stop_codon:yes gene_type:complete
MTWDSIFAGLLILSCVASGMFLGAWIAARGFEKSLVATMNDPKAPWNKDIE